MASNCSHCALGDLLDSTPYTLAYALPLLLISFVITFAGTFLTLDRTTIFAPRTNIVKSLPRNASGMKRIESSLLWLSMFEGGVGGIAAGYAFAVHFVTFLALLIPSVTTSAALAPKAFLATWLLSSLCCMFLGGRWKYAALVFEGTSGYSTFGVACTVMIHPSLKARIVLVSILTSIGMVLCLLPFAKYQHVFLRVATSSAGAFGMVLSIATLANIPVWREAWSRLWTADGTGWGSSIEKGLSTVYCILLLLGCLCDWFLHRKLGENPDEKWDSYLADYVSALPNEADRAGTFKPLSSFWSRVFGNNHTTEGPAASKIIFPTDADLKRPIPSSYKLQKNHTLTAVASPTERLFHRDPTFLRKHRKKGVRGFRRMREAVKFSPLNVDDLSSDSEEDTDSEDLKPPVKTWVAEHRPSLSRGSSVTLADEDVYRGSAEKDAQQLGSPRLRAGFDTADYSDFEDDVTTGATHRPPSGLDGASDRWQPGFLRRASLKAEESSLGPPSQRSAPFSQRSVVEQPASSSVPASLIPPPAFTPVPATPSLVRAIERVQAAYIPAPESPAEPKGPKWNSFWQEVKAKAGPEHHTHGTLH